MISFVMTLIVESVIMIFNLKQYVYDRSKAILGQIVGSVTEKDKPIVYRVLWLHSNTIDDAYEEDLCEYKPVPVYINA